MEYLLKSLGSHAAFKNRLQLIDILARWSVSIGMSDGERERRRR